MYSHFLTWASDRDPEINNTLSESVYSSLYRFEQQLRFSGSYAVDTNLYYKLVWVRSMKLTRTEKVLY